MKSCGSVFPRARIAVFSIIHFVISNKFVQKGFLMRCCATVLDMSSFFYFRWLVIGVKSHVVKKYSHAYRLDKYSWRDWFKTLIMPLSMSLDFCCENLVVFCAPSSLLKSACSWIESEGFSVSKHQARKYVLKSWNLGHQPSVIDADQQTMSPLTFFFLVKCLHNYWMDLPWTLH